MECSLNKFLTESSNGLVNPLNISVERRTNMSGIAERWGGGGFVIFNFNLNIYIHNYTVILRRADSRMVGILRYKHSDPGSNPNHGCYCGMFHQGVDIISYIPDVTSTQAKQRTDLHSLHLSCFTSLIW